MNTAIPLTMGVITRRRRCSVKAINVSISPAKIVIAVDQTHAADLSRRDRGTHEGSRDHRRRHVA